MCFLMCNWQLCVKSEIVSKVKLNHVNQLISKYECVISAIIVDYNTHQYWMFGAQMNETWVDVNRFNEFQFTM